MDQFAGIDISKFGGLSGKEAEERQAKLGFNEIPSAKRRSGLKIALDVAKEPMIALLLITGSLYLALGNPKEAFFLLFFVFVVAGITLYQSRKTERALEALRDLSSPRALALRDGQIKRIAGKEVVAGDVVIVTEGDRVPADGLIAACANFNIDESLLTGESVPVSKIASESIVKNKKSDEEKISSAYSGTLVTTGWGVIKVHSIGAETEMGKIGKALGVIQHEKTNLEVETSRIVKTLAVIGLGLCIAVGVIYGVSHREWLGGILNGLALAMAVIPEEFPVVLVVFLAIGAWRLSKRSVLTRKTSAIEMLGAATVLCVDKTGTITENKMEVKEIVTSQGNEFTVDYALKSPLPEEFHQIAEYSNLEGHKNPFNPIGIAFQKLVTRYLTGSEHIHPKWTLEKEYPLSRELRAVCSAWREDNSVEWAIATKGAPEAIIELSHLDSKKAKEVLERASKMAQDGLRVFGVARAKFVSKNLPENPHDFKFDFLGLVGLEDPVRPSVPKAVAECYEAGIRVIMITGDYPETAKSIARQIGLKNSDNVIMGHELDSLGDKELEEKIGTINICARVVPEQKLRIVSALKKLDEIVAMTGDGVNDAPALKAAHIGIAMGERGTDVAREASSIVLLDDNFSSIVAAVRAGRRIFDNLRKAMAYIVAIHVPIAGLSLVPVLFGWPLVLYPVHIVFLELIIDPACSVVFEAEPEESRIMKRPPRKIGEPIFNSNTVLMSLMQGVAITLLVIIVFASGLKYGLGSGDLRAISFVALVIANLGLIIINLSIEKPLFRFGVRENKALGYVLAGALAILVLVLETPFLRGLFSFSELHLNDFVLAFGVGLAGVAITRGIRLIFKRQG